MLGQLCFHCVIVAWDRYLA